jgi:hypothetical protein
LALAPVGHDLDLRLVREVLAQAAERFSPIGRHEVDERRLLLCH